MADRLRRSGQALEDQTDETLIGLLATGSVDAMTVIYDRHASSAYALAHRVTRDSALAEDVTQNAFMTLWRSRHQYASERGPARAWLLGIVRHRAIDALRSRSVRERAFLAGEEPLFTGDTGHTHDPHVITHRRELSRIVRDAMRSLPAEQHQVIGLAYFGGFSQSEIAALTGVPIGTVKSRARLALRTLQATLDGSLAGTERDGTRRRV